MDNVESSDAVEFELTRENRGVGAAASIVIFARSTGRKATSLTDRHFNEYQAWVEQHPEETELNLKVHLRGAFTKLTEHVDEVTEEQLTAYKQRVGLS